MTLELTKRVSKPEDLALRVTYGGMGMQSNVENSHMRLADFDREYVNFSGFFGTHGPHLFAAAPELLAAAQKALNYVANTEGELGITLDSGDALRAAIAKATGQ